MTTRLPRFRTILTVAMVAIALVATAACGGSDAADEATLSGYEREPEPTVGSITLPAANRDTDAFAFMADPGELLVVYFGYTSCPDVCPTTLADTRQALTMMGEQANSVDLAFVTIDPDRDTDEVTTDYVEAFIDDGIALRTEEPDELAIAADAFGASFSVVENDEGEIEVAHSPQSYVVDDTGSILLTWPFGVSAEDIMSDLTILLDRQQQA